MSRHPASGAEFFEVDGTPLPPAEPSHIHVLRPSHRHAAAERSSRPPAERSAGPEERGELGER